MICQSFGLWAGFLLCSPPIHMNVWQVWAHTQIRTKYGLPVCCFFLQKNIEPITLVHGWISLDKLPTGKQMKAVWFPKVLTSPNSQQNSPKHGHREPLTHAWAQKLQRSQVPLEILGRRAPNPKDSALSSKNHEAQTSQNLSVTVSLWFQVSALSTSFNLDTNASEWSKKSGRLPNISKKYVDEPSK